LTANASSPTAAILSVILPARWPLAASQATVKLLDGNTGNHLCTVNIEKAAKLSARENSYRGPHFEKWKPFEPENVVARTAEDEEPGTLDTPDASEAVAA
jgi:hypothetical protein